MNADEQAIRELIQAWLSASAAGDLDAVLALMSDDVVFLTPGQQPFGKEAFAAASRASQGKFRIEGAADVQEVQVCGDMAFSRVKLDITVRTPEGAEDRRLSGQSLSILRKQGGRWVIVRDANFVTPRRQVRAAVPVFRVASVARSVAWYRDILGFAANPFGPPDEPTFAILSRDGVELMLQGGHREAGPPPPPLPEEGWSAYIRVADVRKVREALLDRVPDAEPITRKEYGCEEFTLVDPDGHVLAIGECG
jgi:uncharacterized protein (TIGR02246 family)